MKRMLIAASREMITYSAISPDFGLYAASLTVTMISDSEKNAEKISVRITVLSRFRPSEGWDSNDDLNM